MRTLPVLLATAAALVVGLGSSYASAQQASFGYRSPNAFTVENIAGVGWDRMKVEGQDADSTTTVGQLSGFQTLFRLSLPARVGYHRFVSDGLSLGLLATYLETGSSTTGYMVGPRIGYSFSLGEDLSFWLRGGINYNHVKFGYQTDGSLNLWNLMAAGDLLFVYTPVPHVGLIFGAIAEFGFTGKASAENSDRDADIRQTYIAGTMGFLLDF